MNNQTAQELVADATLDFALDNVDSALEKIDNALAINEMYFEAYHAKTEILLSLGKLNEALEAAERAFKLKPDDTHINTSLSRIWVALGDKEKAEHFGAQARMLGWKDEIQKGSPEQTPAI